MSPAASLVSVGNTDRRFGAALAANFLLVCAIKASMGVGAEIFWISHVALALAAAGLLIRSTLLASTALTIIALPHLFWLLDCAIGYATGEFPLGLTSYLLRLNAWQWVATAHHFYLLPLLYILIIRQGRYCRGAFPAAIIACMTLTLVGRFLLPRELNANQAFFMLPRVDHPIVHWANALPAAPYMLLLNAGVGLGMILPAAGALTALSRSAAVTRQDRHGSSIASPPLAA